MSKSIVTTSAMERYSLMFLVVVVGFITCLVTSNIIAVKMIDIFGFVVPASVIIFPLSYIFGDILTEVYGYSRARYVIWLGFGCNFLVVITIWTAQIIPGASFWDGQTAYERILGYTPRILAASFLAYLIGEFANSYILAKMKILTKGRWLWMRTIGSTLIGEGLDSMVFITLAFIGTMPAVLLLSTITTQWLAKSLYEAVATPFTYIVVNFLKQHESLDIYDHGTQFNPFKVSG